MNSIQRATAIAVIAFPLAAFAQTANTPGGSAATGTPLEQDKGAPAKTTPKTTQTTPSTTNPSGTLNRTKTPNTSTTDQTKTTPMDTTTTPRQTTVPEPTPTK